MVKKGDIIPNFLCDTGDGTAELRSLLGENRTILLFLRYLGCRACQVSLYDAEGWYRQLDRPEDKLLVVVQSPAETAVSEGLEYHFPLIFDPEGKLYEALDIRPAASKEGLGGPKTSKAVQRAEELGFVHGAYEGNELQLPAAFCVDRDLKLLEVYYGTGAADIPEMEELESWLA